MPALSGNTAKLNLHDIPGHSISSPGCELCGDTGALPTKTGENVRDSTIRDGCNLEGTRMSTSRRLQKSSGAQSPRGTLHARRMREQQPPTPRLPRHSVEQPQKPTQRTCCLILFL